MTYIEKEIDGKRYILTERAGASFKQTGLALAGIPKHFETLRSWEDRTETTRLTNQLMIKHSLPLSTSCLWGKRKFWYYTAAKRTEIDRDFFLARTYKILRENNIVV